MKNKQKNKNNNSVKNCNEKNCNGKNCAEKKEFNHGGNND